MDVEKLHNEVLRAFNDSCVIATRQYGGRGFRPSADAYYEEDTREIVVRFDLAGMAMSDIELLVDRRELVVRGERTFQTREGRVYQQVEMDYGRSSAACASWSTWSRKSPPATYEAGVLEVRLTLTPQDQGARKIDIQTGGGDE